MLTPSAAYTTPPLYIPIIACWYLPIRAAAPGLAFIKSLSADIDFGPL